MSTLKTNNIQHVDRSDPSIIISTDGGVSIAGTLTYEDVTSVDAVGIVTAREILNAQKQVHVGTGVSVKAGGINVTAGITTVQALQATTGTFSGQMQSASAVVTGGITATGGNIVMNDSSGSSANRIKLGTSQDLSLFHNGTHSFINNSQGTLVLQSDVVSITNEAGNSNRFNSNAAGNVFLYFSDSVKLKTTGSGVDITDTLNVAGVSTHTGLAQFANTINLTHASAGQNYIYFNEDLQFAKNGTGTRLKIDSGGRLLKGITSARGNYGNNTSGVEYGFQIEGTSAITAGLSIVRNSNDANDGGIVLGKTRATSTGGNTVVQAGDDLGNLTFAGSDGTSLLFGAEIFAVVQSGVGNDDMPADLIFKTNGGSTSTSERLRITSAGRIGINDGSPDNILHITDGNPYVEIEGTSNSGDAGVFLNAKANHWIMRADNSSSQNIFSVKSGDPSSSTHRFVINSVGDYGFNDTSITGHASNNNTVLSIKGKGSSYSGKIDFKDSDGNLDSAIISDNAVLTFDCDPGGQNGNTIMQFKVHNGVERLRMLSSGDILVGNYLGGGTNQPRVFFLSEGGNYPDQLTRLGLRISNGYSDASIRAYSNTDSWNHVKFYSTHTGSIVTAGSITQANGNSIAYNTSSDYRLKENDVAISDGITRLKQLRPIRFNWKTDTSTKVDGFYAHEVSGIVPEAIAGEKDGVVTQAMIDAGEIDEPIGNPVYQQMDHSKLVPLLTAALQEEVAKREALEVRIAAIEKIAGI